MFKTRLLSGIVMIALAILFIYFGGYLLAAVLMVLSAIGCKELLSVFKLNKTGLSVLVYLLTALFYCVLVCVKLFKIDFTLFIIPFIIFVFVISLAFFVFKFPGYKIDDISKAIFTFFYVSFMLGFIYLTRIQNQGIYMVWLIFLTSWGCDTCAYCVGKLFGKHKMSPVLSPKKSIEGAVGGVVGCMILTFVFFNIFKGNMGIDLTEITILSILSGLGALISMVGDLAASAIKRNYDIKDYGNLIPGHGGVLDRFDSVIICAPIVYLFGYIFT